MAACSPDILGGGPYHLWGFAFPLLCGNGGKSRKSYGEVEDWGERGGEGVVVLSFPTCRPEEGSGAPAEEESGD